MRVEYAFPAIVSHDEFRRVARMLRSRAPSLIHPRRASSPYLLSGLLKCRRCGTAFTGQEAKSGQFAYYVCNSLATRGAGTCDAPRLNAKRFERLIVDQIRENILTESNIRDLVNLVSEEMDGVAHEQRQKLETIESELAEARRRLDRLYNLVETTDLDMADVAPASESTGSGKSGSRLAAGRGPAPCSLSAGPSSTAWTPSRPTPKRCRSSSRRAN